MAGKLGTEKMFENDQVSVWNFEIAPGEETEMHTHERNYMWYAIQGSTVQVLDENDNDLGSLEIQTGDVYSFKVEDGDIVVLSEPSKGVRFPAKHKARHIGATTYREVMVEYKT